MENRKTKLSREELAKIEIGQTELSRTLAYVLVFAFLLTIYSVPVIQQLIDQKRAISGEIKQTSSSVFEKSTKSSGMISVQGLMTINTGLLRRINLYQDHLDDSMFLTRMLNPPLQSLMTGWLKGGNEQAYCGRGEWLFYRPDIEYLTGRGFLDPKVLEERRKVGSEWVTPPQPDPIKALKIFRDQLAQRNIELLIVPVPSKPMIYPDKYSIRYEDRTELLQNNSFAEFLRCLDDAQIPCFDPAPLLIRARENNSAPLFLKSDTHWSPLGMRLVARGLTEMIHDMNVFDQQSSTQYSRVASEINNLGDIAAMLKLPSTQDFYHNEIVSVEKIMQSDGRHWQADPQAEILFLGDSFANIYSLDGMGWGESAGFVETLSADLGRPIDRIVINDNGSYATRRILSRDQQKGIDRLAGKRLVIYEFAVRELSRGDWRVDLDLTLNEFNVSTEKKQDSLKYDNNAIMTEEIEVRGRVAAITKVPSPGTVPYKDCILAIHLVDLQEMNVSVPVNEIMVYAWGMRDSQLTANSGLQQGQWVTMNLTPWSRVENNYGSYNRQEFDNDDLLFIDTYWMLSEDHRLKEKNKYLTSNESESISTKKDIPAVKSADASSYNDFLDEINRILLQLDSEQQNVWRGRDGWLFFAPELRSMSVGQFWGERAAEVSQAMNPQYADPLPAILDFNNQLENAGIDLWIVPVPQKAAIYPSLISENLKTSESYPHIRYDKNDGIFYEILQSHGVQVIDLCPLFSAAAQDGEPLYCLQDTHWSGRAIDLTSRDLADRIKKLDWYEQVPKKQYQEMQHEIEITGDLMKMLGDKTLAKEKVKLSVITEENNNDSGVSDWRESPVLLLGDSHNLVFHVGHELFEKGAGLPDLLARDIGFPVDLVGVRGSGATSARINLLRRRDNLKGKRLLIWCFTAREFTESTDGWRKVPIIR